MDWISLSFLFSYDQYWSVLSVVVYHMFHMSVRRHHWPECLETSAQRVLMLLKMSVVLCTCVLLASYIHNLYLPISRILFLSQCVLTHSLLTLSRLPLKYWFCALLSLSSCSSSLLTHFYAIIYICLESSECRLTNDSTAVGEPAFLETKEQLME